MQSSSSVLRAAVAGAPLVTILGVYNRTFFDLVARPEIKSLNDLRGKPVGISRYGASTEYAVRFALKANNIDPDKDVTLLAIGSGTDAARISALEAKVVAAAVLQVPSNLVAHKLGQKTLLPLGDYMETLFAGLGTSQKKLQIDREEAKQVVRAVTKSLDYMSGIPSKPKRSSRETCAASKARQWNTSMNLSSIMRREMASLPRRLWTTHFEAVNSRASRSISTSSSIFRSPGKRSRNRMSLESRPMDRCRGILRLANRRRASTFELDGFAKESSRQTIFTKTSRFS